MAKKIGNDEFCLFCMEWREYDEEGRCKICKKIIHKPDIKQQKDRYDEYKSETPLFEIEEDFNDDDY